MTWTVYRLARLPIALPLALIAVLLWGFVCLVDPSRARTADWWWLIEWLWPPR